VPADDDAFPNPINEELQNGENTRDRNENRLRGGFEPEVARERERRNTNGALESGLRGTTSPQDDTLDAEGQAAANSDDLTRDPTQNQLPRDAVLDPEQTDPGQQEVEDPFAPLGIRLGSFLLFPELRSEAVYDDNVFLSSTDPQGDWAYELTPSLTFQSDWSRHSLVGTLSAVRSYHDKFTTENEEDFAAEVTGRLDIRSSTNLVGSASYAEEPEDRSSNDFPLDAADRAVTRTRDVSLEGNHTFNRVTLTLRGELSDEDFDDATANDGSAINNDDRDFTEQRVTARAAYEFQPGVAAFVEASSNERDFAQDVDDDGLLSGSSGHDVQAGISFLLSGKLTGEASIGYAMQTPDETSQKDVEGVIFNAGLEWQATGLTTFRLDASSDVDETTDSGSGGSIVRNVEVSVEHRPRRNIIVGASLGYENEKFSGTGQEEEEWLFGVNGEYIFTRSVALTVAYEHARNTSNVPGDGYTGNEVRFGVRVRQ